MGTAALLLGANMPDLDVLAYFDGPAADLAWRRGWSHGVLALILFPFLLTGALVIAHRMYHRNRRADSAPVLPREVLLLSSIAILSHPILDTLNTYGVRWLMPFSSRWFYGDALFIVDPWMWLLLGLGVAWSWWRRRQGTESQDQPARLAVSLAALYVVGMWASGRLSAKIIAREIVMLSHQPLQSVMAGPLPLTLFRREFVVQEDSVYRVGTFRWLSRPHIDLKTLRTFPREKPRHPAMATAESTQIMQRFLSWARFPTFEIQEAGTDHYLVHVVDLRYARRPGTGFGTITIPVGGRQQEQAGIRR